MSDAAPILVIGRTGQLARALALRSEAITAVGRETLDLSWSEEKLEEALSKLFSNPLGGVINAAAYTQVDQAETDFETAMAVNGDAPGVIARLCADHDLPFVHISTDYVFKGDGTRPYRPDDMTDPVNAYGRTKRAGETAIEAVDDRFAILRTSWVYDGDGKNFLTTMLRLSESRDTVSVVDDQIGRPTHAQDLALAAINALNGVKHDQSKSGLYHVSNSGDPISWADFAEAIFERAGKAMTVVRIPSEDYPTPAKRPAFSVLDTHTFEQTFNTRLPDWKDGLARAMQRRTVNATD